MIDPQDKAKILSYAQERAQRAANVTSFTTDEDLDLWTDSGESHGSTDASPSREANVTQQDPTSNVHPADVHRMMSNGNKKKESTSTPSRAANSVRWAANTASQNPSDVWGGATETSSHSGSKSGSSRSVSSASTNSSQKPPPLLNRTQAMAHYSDDSMATSDQSLPSLMDRHKPTYSDESTATPDPYSVCSIVYFPVDFQIDSVPICELYSLLSNTTLPWFFRTLHSFPYHSVSFHIFL